MNTFIKKEDIWALSITITGKCNCNCSYCHFYASRNRDKYNVDMSELLFNNYVSLIKYIKNTYHKNLQIRFSGGEPLVIGDKLFEYSKKIYDETGFKPYVLTNGLLLTPEVIKKSKAAHISAFLVSIENPFDQADGAPKTDAVLNKINDLNCEDVQVLPAIMVIKNSSFSRLFEIANYVYDKIGVLPSFSELTYQSFEIPSDKEIAALHINIRKIAEKYYGKTAIRIFPYVSPELYANNQKNYLSEMDLENSIGISEKNIYNVAKNMFNKLNMSYRPNPCKNKNCDWFEDCRIIKWLWLYNYNNPKITVDKKLNAFCSMKKAMNSGLYEGIMNTIGEINAQTITRE